MKTTIRGLKMLCAFTPYAGWSSTLLDVSGEWTEKMIKKHDEACRCDESGLRVWEGSCTVTTAKELPLARGYEFEGAWRKLHPDELADLGDDLMTLSRGKFPQLEEEIALPER